MAELGKVKRSLAKHDPKAPHETLLVVDATTGSNALAQAREFHQSVGLTGLIVTKLDGSGKGGIVIAIQDELGNPDAICRDGRKTRRPRAVRRAEVYRADGLELTVSLVIPSRADGTATTGGAPTSQLVNRFRDTLGVAFGPGVLRFV